MFINFQSNIKKVQAGFSLVELLVGMAMSIIIGTLAVGHLVSSSRSLTSQNNTDLIQENARFAFEFLSSDARLAGLNNVDDPNKVNSEAVRRTNGIATQAICGNDPHVDPVGGGVSSCTFDGFNYTLGGVTYDSDRIAFDYVTNRATTCTGTDINTDIRSSVSVVSVYWVGDIDGDGVTSLYCQAYTSAWGGRTYNNYTPTSPVAAPIVDGVDSLQVLYGVDTSGDGNINTYTTYNNILPADRDGIQSIKVGLLVNSGQIINTEINVEGQKERRYRVLDALYISDVSDDIQRQVLSTTIDLPNMPLQFF